MLPHCGGGVDHERDADQCQLDLLEVRLSVTRFRVGVGRCRDCGRRLQGRHPEQTSDALGAAASHVGPLAKACSNWLHYGLGLSFAKCARLLTRLGIDVSAGAICQAAQRTGTDLVPVYAEIVRRVNDAGMAVADETGWRVGGRSAWLWVATTEEATAYNVANGRGFEEATDILHEDFDGVVVRDGWAPYRRYTNTAHQTCLAHLIRRCDEPTCRPGPGRPLARWATPSSRPWPPVTSTRRAGPRSSRTWPRRLELLATQPQGHHEVTKLVNHLQGEADALFTFWPARASTPPTGGGNRPSGRPWSTARSGAATGPGEGPPPRAR